MEFCVGIDPKWLVGGFIAIAYRRSEKNRISMYKSIDRPWLWCSWVSENPGNVEPSKGSSGHEMRGEPHNPPTRCMDFINKINQPTEPSLFFGKWWHDAKHNWSHICPSHRQPFDANTLSRTSSMQRPQKKVMCLGCCGCSKQPDKIITMMKLF